MYLLGAALVEKLCGLPQLCTADDGVVNEKKTLVADQGVYGNQLHAGDQISLVLACRHEGTRPGWRIFNERTGKWDAGFIGIADGMCDTGVRNACNQIRFGVIASGKHFSAGIAHGLHIDSLIGGGRIAVVNPEEGTDFHLLPRCAQRFDSLRSHKYNLAGA